MYLRSPSENLETIANQIKHLKREVNNYNQYTTGLLYLGFAECVFYFPSETCTTWGIYSVFFVFFWSLSKSKLFAFIHASVIAVIPYIADKASLLLLVGGSRKTNKQHYTNYVLIRYTYIYTWNPNDPSFGWLNLQFYGSKPWNQGSFGFQVYIYIHT